MPEPLPTAPLHISLIGTRGVPAAYGGFETAVEEVGQRLAAAGHRVTVYCRGSQETGDRYLGMRRVTLPAARKKSLETLTHTALSVGHSILKNRPDVAFVFNAANSPLLPVLRASGVPVALHMDGLEWRRSKWGAIGRKYYRSAEHLGVRTADALIADSAGIAEYYKHQFGAETELIKYGAPLLHDPADSAVKALGLEPNGYHLVVARFEPENHVLEIITGYTRSQAAKPLVVVGSAPYAESYTTAIQETSAGDSRIHLLGAVYDQQVLDALYFHAYTYIHGHSVGGTNPSLLRAIGAGTAVVAFDVSFNRVIIGNNGWLFESVDDVAVACESAESAPDLVQASGRVLRDHAAQNYTWDEVATQYEELARRLHAGHSVRPKHRRAHRNPIDWNG